MTGFPAAVRRAGLGFGRAAACLAAGVLLAASAPGEGARAEPVTVALPSANFGAMAALATAREAGLFAARGVELQLRVLENGPTAIAALISNSAAFAVSGPAEVVHARARGRDLVLVANLYRGLSGSLVLSREAAARTGVSASGPVEVRVRALDGLLIAVPSPTSSLLAPIRAAAEAASAKVRFTYMAQTGMAAALSAGSIDGLVASSPVWMAPIAAGRGILWIDGPRGELPETALPVISGALVTTRDYATAHPATVRSIRAALDDLAALVRTDPARARTAFAAAYPQLGPDAAERSFAGEAANFTRPELTADDIRRELATTGAAGGAAGQVDPASLLFRPEGR